MTFSTESASDPGTVYYYRNVLNMRNVKGKVKNSYRPHKMLYYTVLDGIIMALFYNHFGLNDFESDIPVSEHFQKFTEEQKFNWLNDICEEIVQKWFFDNGTDIRQSLMYYQIPITLKITGLKTFVKVVGLNDTFVKRIMLL